MICGIDGRDDVGLVADRRRDALAQVVDLGVVEARRRWSPRPSGCDPRRRRARRRRWPVSASRLTRPWLVRTSAPCRRSGSDSSSSWVTTRFLASRGMAGLASAWSSRPVAGELRRGGSGSRASTSRVRPASRAARVERLGVDARGGLDPLGHYSSPSGTSDGEVDVGERVLDQALLLARIEAGAHDLLGRDHRQLGHVLLELGERLAGLRRDLGLGLLLQADRLGLERRDVRRAPLLADLARVLDDPRRLLAGLRELLAVLGERGLRLARAPSRPRRGRP